jgi:hypothetical protein
VRQRPRPLAVALVVASAGMASAQGQQGPLHATFYSDQLQSSIIRVALDTRSPLPEGTRLFEDGRQGSLPASSIAFTDAGLGIGAVLAIDSSGSMKGKPFEAVKAALHDFVSSSRPLDRIALISFADTVEVRQPFTNDKELLGKAIDSLAPTGRSTVLNQAIDKALTLLAGESTARRHLLVITDGKNEGSGPAFPALTKRAREIGIPVTTIGITRLAPSWLAPMISLAQATGGAYIRVRNHDELKGAMRDGIDWLMRSPFATFKLAHVKPDGARHQFRVVMAGRTTETVEMAVPKPALSRSFLYGSVGAAALLFALGMALIVYSKRSRQPAVATPPRFEPPEAQPGAAKPVTGARAERTKTVLVAAASASMQPSVAPPKPMPGSQQRVASPAPGMQPPVHQATEFRSVFPQPTIAQPAAWLRASEGPGAGTAYPVNGINIQIGAGSGNQIALAGDSTVSMNHATLTWERGDLYLLDDNSTNGTSINGRKIAPGVRVRLQPGDRIGIGRQRFTLDG